MKTTLIETDDLDSENNYYLYEVEDENKHYYTSTSDEEIKNNGGKINFANEYNMLKREDFTDRQWEIAKYLFFFLWDSCNGTNTCADPDIYEEDGFTREEMEEFVKWFNDKQPNEVLDFYYEDNEGVEIFWAYFSCFDLTCCNPHDDYAYDENGNKELDFEDLFSRSLTKLMEENGGSIESTLDQMRITDEKVRKAIKDWCNWEDD